jgi:diaminohydroxyphosphoribosylaminopyrimidine deaminase/5-amino-6-(5-phosphoribosylamino)uracil reductase
VEGFSAADSAFMAQALRLAARGRYTAHPNPMVGCVLVNDGRVVGQGWHELAGEAHAEVNALREAGAAARGSTAYVTLEPCSHHGKTPPCAEALVAAGVAEVVVAMEDPFPAVRGSGLAALRAAGLGVRTGLMNRAATDLLEGFTRRVTRGRPLVRVKIAASIDGAIAMANGESRWITGDDARADVQRLRARSGAVLTGIGTVLADDPSLTVRDADIDMRGRQPLRAVVDSRLRMPAAAAMLTLPGRTRVYCCADGGPEELQGAGAEVVQLPEDEGRVRLEAVLDDLGRQEINEVLVEAGPTLAGRILLAQLVDELVIYQAPHIMGSETRRMFATPAWTSLAGRAELELTDVRRVGGDMRITARIRSTG